MALCLAACFAVCSLMPGGAAPAFAQSTAAQPAAADDDPRYDGLTLDEWRQRIKNLNLRSAASREAVPGLMAIVRDEGAPWVSRRQAAETLGRMGANAAEAVPLLIELLGRTAEDESSSAAWAARALALFGPVAQGAAPTLAKIAFDESRPSAERQAALGALSQIGTAHPEVLPTLTAMLKYRPSPGSKTSAQTAVDLRALAAESLALQGPGALPALPALLQAANDDSALVRQRAVVAIGALGPASEPAVPLLVERFVFDDAGEVRDAAAEALSRVGRAAVPVLTNLLDDQETYVRQQAAVNLGRIGPPAAAAMPRLLARLDAEEDPRTRLEAAQATWRITSRAEPFLSVLIDSLAQEDRQLQLQALRMLSTLGAAAKPAGERLRRLVQDERSHVRRAAEKALEQLAD